MPDTCEHCKALDEKWQQDSPEGSTAINAREYRDIVGHWASCPTQAWIEEPWARARTYLNDARSRLGFFQLRKRVDPFVYDQLRTVLCDLGRALCLLVDLPDTSPFQEVKHEVRDLFKKHEGRVRRWEAKQARENEEPFGA
jgi:hypothetical protein